MKRISLFDARAAIVVAVSACLLGCLRPGAGGEGDAGISPDGGSTTFDAGVIQVADAGAGITKSGFIVVTQIVDQGRAVASLNAMFTTSTGSGNSICAPQTLGDCVFEDCTPRVGPGSPGSTQVDSAGDVTMTGSLVDGGVVAFENTGTFDGYNAFVAGALFTGGEMLTINSTGSVTGAPSFSSTIIAPSKITVTAPVCSSQGCPNINRTGTLTFTWPAAGQTGRVRAAIVLGVSSRQTQRLVCTTDASVGSLTIPATTLSLLSAGATGSLEFSNISETKFAAGAYLIHYQVSTSGVAGSTAVQ